ncbi:hypothetical protein B0H17DRAFT_1137725 [Mycena rosella]|uniref:Ubiquitin-like protease family profile domain-containing protein n=1 Tax=Mycena rosella TaxID=1033263 RepID=A0AAD7D9K1_MYCRO|nr:hypothetical protein B0H17DRAFT_1137725 [Mycena rosella]
MRLDRLSRYYCSPRDAWAYQAKTRRPAQAHCCSTSVDGSRPSSNTPPVVLESSGKGQVSTDHSGDDSEDNGESDRYSIPTPSESDSHSDSDSDDDSVPNLADLSDCESDYESDSDPEDENPHRKIPVSSSYTPQPRKSSSFPLHCNGGGSSGPPLSVAPPASLAQVVDLTSDSELIDLTSNGGEPIDVTLTSDDENPQVFVPEEWIGLGKVWSDSFPMAVKRARNAARFVPLAIRDSVIPDRKCTVTELLASELPAPLETPDHATYSTEPPSVETAICLASWLDTLLSAVPYLSNLRATSIRFPHLPDLYPLWTENLLFDVKSYLWKRFRWQHATDWIDDVAQQTQATAYTHVDDLVRASQDMLEIIPWDCVVPGLSPSVHLTSLDLALFLSFAWLNDEMINTGTDYILRRLEPGSRVRILNCLFIQALANARVKLDVYIPTTFSLIERGIRAGAVDVVWFPLHVSGNHWTLLKIDLVTKTMAYADSLNGSPPMDELALIRWWLKCLLPSSDDFVLVEPDFPCPRQRDGHSCGIIMLSILTSILLKYDAWIPERAQCQRMEWFLRLSETFADDEGDFDTGSYNYRSEATTPDPSDYASSAAPSSDYDSCRADRPVQQLSSSPASPLLHAMDTTSDDVILVDVNTLELEEVDLFMDLEMPAVVDFPPSSPRSDPPPPSDPLSTSSKSAHDWAIRNEDHYTASDGEESDDSDSHESRDLRQHQHRRASGPKAGSSWAMQKELIGVSKEPDFRPNASRLGTFRAKVLADDPKAEFDNNDVRRVRCSYCAHWLEMRALYDLVRWKDHRATSKCTKARSKGKSTQSLFTPGFKKIPKVTSAPVASSSPQFIPTIHNLPCPGLTAESNQEIATYLARTAVAGGGAPSRRRITAQLFSSEDLRWKDLDSDQQRMVLRRELSLHQWKLARSVGAIFSTNCLCDVPMIEGQTAQPCSECRTLYKLHTFQVAIHRPMADEKHMKKRAKLPKFLPDISALNVARVSDVLKKLDYKGPVLLAWDDTALEAAISIHQQSKDVCLILGSVDGTITVTENDDLDALFAKAKLRKVDKLINLLHEYDIHPISMASDGAEVERAMQRLIADSAPSHHIYVIPNSTPGCHIELRIPLYFGHHPTIMCQDSKHGLKTVRNQIHTGAHILIIAFFVILYAHLRELVLNIAGPLFTRDVEKVDKQDDRAAAWVFSATTLEFLLKHHPDHVGLAVYLFVLGELVDAWQNRNISHRDRAKMVLRARFFLMAWRSHIVSHPDYSVQTQFISRESYDIFITLCDSLISLIIAYRRYFPLYPLLPWLHSTEACEHLFGMLRQLKKDFTYSDVLHLEHKLRVLQMGYHHTYFKADDLDIATLMQYPTDQEIADASKYGLAEASQLLKLLGINAEAMLRDYMAPEPSKDRPPNAPRSRPPQTWMQLLALYELVPLKSSTDEETFETCEMAIAADSVDKSRAIAALPDSTDDSIEQLRVDIKKQLTIQTLGSNVPLPSDCALALTVGHELNHGVLVKERMRHQTKSTAKAVRQHGRLSTAMANRNNSTTTTEERGSSLRERLMKKLASVVPVSDTVNNTTGVDRYVRHAGTFGGSGVPANAQTQNKATVQKVAAMKFVEQRAKALGAFQWVHDNMHLANITEFNPLKPGHYFLALKPGAREVILCEVITLYTKNTNHDWIPAAMSVGTPSYVYASVYLPFAGATFTSMFCPSLACGTFLRIPRTHILFSLASFAAAIQRQDLRTADGYPHALVTLCAKSQALYDTLRANQNSLFSAVVQLVQMVKSKTGDEAIATVIPGAAGVPGAPASSAIVPEWLAQREEEEEEEEEEIEIVSF